MGGFATLIGTWQTLSYCGTKTLNIVSELYAPTTARSVIAQRLAHRHVCVVDVGADTISSLCLPTSRSLSATKQMGRRLDRLHTFLTACRWHVEYTSRNFWDSSVSLTARAHSQFRVDCSAGRSCRLVELHRVDFGHSQRRSACAEP